MGDELHEPTFCKKRAPILPDRKHKYRGSTGAGRLHRQIAHLKMRVFAKLGVAGYQPYERLGLWLRRELAPLVQRTLLDDSCLDSGVFNPDTVRHVVQRHFSGQANHTYLIMALLVFTTGHRSLLSGKRIPQFGIIGPT